MVEFFKLWMFLSVLGSENLLIQVSAREMRAGILSSTMKRLQLFSATSVGREKNFDIQNNDFGWAHLPFSFMNENTVFMLITAMLKNFFLHLTQMLSGSIGAIKKTSRLKKVIIHFVCVPAKWIRSGRRNILRL